MAPKLEQEVEQKAAQDARQDIAQNSSQDLSRKASQSLTKDLNKPLFKLLEEASQPWLSTPYKMGGTDRIKGSDCSNYVQTLMRDFGYNLPRSTREQMRVGKVINKNELKSADLVFFKTGKNTYHVGIFLEGKNFLHLSRKGGVKNRSLDEKYWKARYIGARRFPTSLAISLNKDKSMAND